MSMQGKSRRVIVEAVRIPLPPEREPESEPEREPPRQPEPIARA